MAIRRHETHEHTINIAMAEVLRGLGHDWDVKGERIGDVIEGGGRPDIFLSEPGGSPVVIEAEVGNYHQAEIEARSRLGRRFSETGRTVDTVVALIYPEDLRTYDGDALRNAIQNAVFEYSVFTQEALGEVVRVPSSGWLSSGIIELALLLHRSRVPSWRVESLANTLEQGIVFAAGLFSDTHRHGSELARDICTVLGQKDDEAGQARRMVMAVIINALVFQDSLAETETQIFDIHTNTQRRIKFPREFRENGALLPTLLVDEWKAILKVNYWPIFYTAGEIIRRFPTRTAVEILNALWETVERLIAGGVTKSHDLTGVIFQRLIADRKFLATYYTKPAAAALLAGLAMPLHRPLGDARWDDAETLAAARIGDFACGTGTLLSTAYQRLGLLHELHGGNPAGRHPKMMKYGLVGLDVLNVAVHLTATMLASTQPNTSFEGECLLTMPYGRHQWGASLGSLDLLVEDVFDIVRAAAQTAGGRGEEQVRDLINRIGHHQFELVIMNPPFTRHGAREGDRTLVHNPAFAAFEATDEEQDLLAQHLSNISINSCGHGHAGMASYFVELAHRKTANAGTIALVLPLSAMSGGSWQKVRNLIRDEYQSILVVTIAEKSTHSRSFSADTGMAECLLIAKKSRPDTVERRAFFAVLASQPKTTLEGELIAQAISNTIACGRVRMLEGGPFGGTRISLGDTLAGEVLDCPLPSNGPWSLVGIHNLSLAQSAYQLTNCLLWIEGMPPETSVALPVVTISGIAVGFGPHHLDITGDMTKADGLPQGPFELHSGCPQGSAYPTLWKHKCEDERRLIVQPDSHCRVREVSGRVPVALQRRAASKWATATRAHYNLDFQFNSQSLIVAMTERPSIGGNAWPSVILGNREHEYTFSLWCNSSLGLLCHWWMSNKTQAGRGRTTITGIPAIPTLDTRSLSEEQHRRAKQAFESLSGARFLPFDQLDEDDSRAELDRLLLVDVLGLDADLCAPGGPIELLRRKLAAEPQIHGGKASRVVFTETGEISPHREQRT